MAKRSPIDKLKENVAKILEEYQADVEGSVAEISQELAKKGAQALRSESAQKFGNYAYAKGWTVETGNKAHRQVYFSSVIYNKTPGLPHLLEHGHVTRNGIGRVYKPTPAHEHIAPIESELISTFEREVKSKL